VANLFEGRHPQPEERKGRGRASRGVAPRSTHAELGSLRSPEDAVRLIEEQNATRLKFLVPLRRGRMAANPFTFFRGSARIMAADLADTPRSGLDVQLGGDAHLSNFGAYASPERRLVFDANDFDETLPGPFEWDVKRLAASFVIAARHNGLDPDQQREVAQRSVQSYREAMNTYSRMGVLRLHYDSADIDDVAQHLSLLRGAAGRERLERFSQKAKTKDSTQALRKLTVESDGRYRIRSDPPVLFPFSELQHHGEVVDLGGAIETAWSGYLESVSDDLAALIERFTPIDMALKVVGVGSVGTRCAILLLEGRDRLDPFFLQFKEAGASVLEEFLEPSAYPHGGRRVVEGQRRVQAASDPFLGWTSVPGGAQSYVRQLKDWKGSVDVEARSEQESLGYAELCGLTLARGHARTGDPIALRGYLGSGDVFDRAVAEFAVRYADRNQECFEAFAAAIRDGELEATTDG
jgi:uncharacterized protein (DUF2252 family)